MRLQKSKNISKFSTCLFGNEHLNYLLGFLNSKVALNILNVLSPTLNYEGSHIASLPVIVDQEKLPVVEKLVEENIRISKEDWDSFEQSCSMMPLHRGKVSA